MPSEGLPRRLIDELITRWTIARLRQIVVEGPSDRRVMTLIQREEYCDPSFGDVDVCAVDGIDVPAHLVAEHGLIGVGAKQRVIAFAREIERHKQGAGFRGLVDQDLDGLLGINHASEVALYTDHACMDAYLWTEATWQRMLIQFRCEHAIAAPVEAKALLDSIFNCCTSLAAVRVCAARHPEWRIDIHRSEKALAINNKTLEFNVRKYLEQAKPAKGALEAALTCVQSTREGIASMNPADVMNSHDALWLATFVLRSFTSGTKRLVDEEAVAGSLTAFGVMSPQINEKPMFKRLAEWVRARPD